MLERREKPCDRAVRNKEKLMLSSFRLRAAEDLAASLAANARQRLPARDCAKWTLAAQPPPELVKLVQSNMEGLERLASSLRGPDNARRFSFFTVEA
jgi:hypothetical protein